MLRPSTAPRWKIVTSTLRRGSTAATVRAMNCGAKPRLTNARPPFFRKMRRECMAALPFLELRGTEYERDGLRWLLRLCNRRLRGGGHIAAEHVFDQRVADDERVGGDGWIATPPARRGQADREVHAGEQGSRVDPRVGAVGVAGRRLAHVERHAEVTKGSHEGQAARGIGAGRAQRADDELERRLDLGPVGRGREELG